MDIEFSSLLEIGDVLAVLLFGSKVREPSLARDTDICIVAPDSKNKASLLLEVFSRIYKEGYDIWLFEELPLYMKVEVIKNHKILACKDIYRLYDYFAKIMRIWGDQEIRIRRYTKELFK
jgi:predicted nucleotidyltransferase